LSSRRRHTRSKRDWSSDVCSSDLSPEGFLVINDGVAAAIARARAYAPYADMLWFETAKPDLGEARQFAEAIHKEHPGKLLAYNRSEERRVGKEWRLWV